MPEPFEQITLSVPAKPAGLWTPAREFIDGPRLLKVSAEAGDTWAYADAATARCGADGHPNAVLSRKHCLVPEAPVGALIGKFGGSSAANDGTPFVAGSYCVVAVPQGGAALFLTINDEFGGMQNNADTITVQISELPGTASCTLLASMARAAAAAP